MKRRQALKVARRSRWHCYRIATLTRALLRLRDVGHLTYGWHGPWIWIPGDNDG